MQNTRLVRLGASLGLIPKSHALVNLAAVVGNISRNCNCTMVLVCMGILSAT